MARALSAPIPYARHEITEEDLEAVRCALLGERITTGAQVARFEARFAERVGARFAVSFNSGTGALHAAAWAAGVGPGAETITTPLTFAATANVAVHLGARPLFADVDPATLTLSPDAAERLITPRTKALLPVDYAGHPCDMGRFRAIARARGLALIEDACHSLGATFEGLPVGSLADVTVFSFHPVKHITSGEGGMATTDDPELDARMRRFRNHGIDADSDRRAARGIFAYDIAEPGFNYRMPDLNAALGLSQLARLDRYVERRRELAALYGELFSGVRGLTLPTEAPWARSSFHLYPVRVDPALRDPLLAKLRERGIGATLHYPPVHLMTFYRRAFGTREGLCPAAELAARSLISLPLFPALTDAEARAVAEITVEALGEAG